MLTVHRRGLTWSNEPLGIRLHYFKDDQLLAEATAIGWTSPHNNILFTSLVIYN